MNVSDLPKVGVKEVDQLPAVPCVYFVLNRQGETLYVGSSVNLRKRWFHDRHHRADQADRENALIAWLVVEKDALLEQEDRFIKMLNPPWNGMNHGGPRSGAGRKPGVPWAGAAHRTRRILMLSDDDVEHAKILGDGNISRGVRRALAGALIGTPTDTTPTAAA